MTEYSREYNEDNKHRMQKNITSHSVHTANISDSRVLMTVFPHEP